MLKEKKRLSFFLSFFFFLHSPFLLPLISFFDQIYVTPSATGTKLFLAGTGDDLSRFTVKVNRLFHSSKRSRSEETERGKKKSSLSLLTRAISSHLSLQGLRIYAHDPQPLSAQFNDPQLRDIQTYSAVDDPAPLVPLPAEAPLPNGSAPKLPALAFGGNYTVTEVIVAVIISRNSLFDSLNIILPVIVWCEGVFDSRGRLKGRRWSFAATRKAASFFTHSRLFPS